MSGKSLSDFRSVQIGDAVLYEGDCLEILPLLPKVDAVVTDPPYGIGFKYESHRDTDTSYPGGYIAWMRGVVESATACLNDGGPSFYWQSQKRIPDFSNLFPSGFRVCVNAKTMGQIFPGTPMQYRWDPIVTFWKGKGQAFEHNAYDFFVSQNSAEYGNANSLEREHPCPRPIKAVAHLLEKWTAKDWCILDPFMGSGTTGVACAKLGRKFIGIELEPKYFDIACKRIEEAYSQPDFFVEPPAKPKQEALEI